MKFVVLGSGKVANSLSSALRHAGHHPLGVWSRNFSEGSKLAHSLKCPFVQNPEKTPADFFLIAVSDDAIYDVSEILKKVKGIVVHTSGSVDIKALSRKKRAGVLYPLDSITGERNLSFKKIPICIESTDENTMHQLMQIASDISNEIYIVDSEQRKKLHIAAVFTNNFTNHLLGLATEILRKEDLPSEILQKLAATTIKNAFKMHPFEIQTGPAKRNDKKTIAAHLKYLRSNKDASELYSMLTSQIIHEHAKRKNKL